MGIFLLAKCYECEIRNRNLSMMFWSCQDATPSVYVLPQNFEGVCAVVYSQKNGVKDIKKEGKHYFYLPENGILVTQTKFIDGWRDDIFLMKTSNGFDTLKNYLPNKDSTGKKFDAVYYTTYTNDRNEVAVNFRQIVNTYPANKNDESCSFKYEIITIGRAATLRDSIGKPFISKLDSFLQSKFCK